MTDSLQSDHWLPYREAFRRDAHQLIQWGYADARQKIAPDSDEDDITGYLADAVHERLDSPTAEDWWDRYDLHHQRPERHGQRKGKQKKKIDIVVRCSAQKPRAEFSFEAKRLKKNGFPVSRYTDDGLLRFVCGEYAPSSPEAAMVGYVQSDSAPYWLSELARKLSEPAGGNLECKKLPVPVSVLASLPDEWITVHGRPDGSEIAVYHIFLDCL